MKITPVTLVKKAKADDKDGTDLRITSSSLPEIIELENAGWERVAEKEEAKPEGKEPEGSKPAVKPAVKTAKEAENVK